MRRLLLLLLLLPVSLVSQVKILMPVVVKNAQGQAVTDLKLSDFEVSGPKNVRIDEIWLVPPEIVSKGDPRTPVVVLYDAANATNPYPDLRTKWLRAFLGSVAEHRLPVTFYINAPDGLRLIYEPSTPPEVLSAALELTENPKATTTDPKVEQQAKNLDLLRTVSHSRNFRSYDLHLNQMKSLTDLAHLLQTSDRRKPVIWLANVTYFPGFTKSPKFWEGPTLPMFEAMVEELNAARISVYPDLFSFRGITNDSEVEYWLYDQKQLAECTGGLSLTKGSIWDALEATLADFGPYYLLVVAVPDPSKLDWIPVNIRAIPPGLTVRAAPGFFGLKPLNKR